MFLTLSIPNAFPVPSRYLAAFFVVHEAEGWRYVAPEHVTPESSERVFTALGTDVERAKESIDLSDSYRFHEAHRAFDRLTSVTNGVGLKPLIERYGAMRQRLALMRYYQSTTSRREADFPRDDTIINTPNGHKRVLVLEPVADWWRMTQLIVLHRELARLNRKRTNHKDVQACFSSFLPGYIQFRLSARAVDSTWVIQHGRSTAFDVTDIDELQEWDPAKPTYREAMREIVAQATKDLWKWAAAPTCGKPSGFLLRFRDGLPNASYIADTLAKYLALGLIAEYVAGVKPRRECQQCGIEFSPSRADALYCSNRCRSAARRERERSRVGGE